MDIHLLVSPEIAIPLVTLVLAALVARRTRK